MRARSLFLLLGVTGAAACTDVLGEWAFTWTVERASGVCEPELGSVSNDVVTIVVGEDNALSLTPFGDDDAAQTGTLLGRTLTFSGEYQEDSGTTVTSTTLILSDDSNSMSGTEDWTWSNANGQSCPDNQSSVEAARVDPR